MLSTNSNLSSSRWTFLVGTNYQSVNVQYTFTVLVLKTTGCLIPGTQRLGPAAHWPYLNLDDCLSQGVHLSFFPRPDGGHLFAYLALATDLIGRHPSSSSSSGKQDDKRQLLQWGRHEGVPQTISLLPLSIMSTFFKKYKITNRTKSWNSRYMLWINT